MKTEIKKYGVMDKDKVFIVGNYDTMDEAKHLVKGTCPYIVELTVTKVFVRSEDYKEVEI